MKSKSILIVILALLFGLFQPAQAAPGLPPVPQTTHRTSAEAPQFYGLQNGWFWILWSNPDPDLLPALTAQDATIKYQTYRGRFHQVTAKFYAQNGTDYWWAAKFTPDPLDPCGVNWVFFVQVWAANADNLPFFFNPYCQYLQFLRN